MKQIWSWIIGGAAGLAVIAWLAVSFVLPASKPAPPPPQHKTAAAVPFKPCPAKPLSPGVVVINEITIYMPDFPWPPPAPSEKMDLRRDRLLAGLCGTPSLTNVGDRISDALEKAGYSEYSYYLVPGGFALAARLEQVEDDGTPKAKGFRFVAPDFDGFSFAAYIRQLFLAPQGFYRMIVFIVTDQPVVTAGAAPSAAAAQAWLVKGADRLPKGMDKTPFSASHRVTALIYEFRKEGKRQVEPLLPGRLTAQAHLEKAGIYDARWVRHNRPRRVHQTAL